ncbi:glycosyl transferase family A [Devosia sp. Root685]|uniref:glycosyltransferase family 2 protein n=1 Tax=Devosia sp. Root685 TaxID=1736587 RepID=UPI0006F64885|nr:glycosyltransferase [Devosia sp. Root685]KRA95534.1 glycosyl transferase family A [Devosia sp. Root685]
MAGDQQGLEQVSRPVAAVVCIPTFRRPDWLARTLASVIAQRTDFCFALVVVDNDAAGSEGAKKATALLSSSAIPHRILIEPDQGNVHAINRAFTEAQAAFPEAEFFLMIDDDEMAMPGWLAAIVATAQKQDADIVGGPVRREFDVPVPDAIARHPLFVSIEGATRAIDQIHGSGNCLIRRRVFAQMGQPPFDVSFNFLGGGDMEFFTRSKRAGFSTWWCQEAVVHEFVPAERVSARFLLKRSIRTGSINYVIDRMEQPAGRVLVKNIGSLGLGFFRSFGLLLRTGSLLGASHPFLMSVGRVVASFGVLPQPYKASR